MMARLVKVNGHPRSLQSTLQRCKGMRLLTLWGSRVAVRVIYYRREVGHWHTYRKPEDGAFGSRQWQLSFGTGIPSHWWSSAPSGLDGVSSRYLPAYLVPAILESDCRLGQRMLPRRRKPGAGPDPKCPTENHPRSLLFPIARSPSPSNKYSTTLGQSPPPIERCDAVRREHLQAGSLGRNAKYQHHSQCPADCSVAPNSIHAAFHLQCRFGSSIQHS